MAQLFHTSVKGEQAAKLLTEFKEVTIPAGVFAGIKVRVFKKDSQLPVGCVGLLINPKDPEQLVLLMQTTDQPAG